MTKMRSMESCSASVKNGGGGGAGTGYKSSKATQ